MQHPTTYTGPVYGKLDTGPMYYYISIPRECTQRYYQATTEGPSSLNRYHRLFTESGASN
eukprot:SAG31_NODE_24345_length_483_cov_2.872396_1_plen_59_part_10